MSVFTPQDKALYRRMGAWLRKKRLSLGYTQQDIADRIGRTYQQVWKWEKGENRVGPADLFRLSQVLGFSLDRMMAETTEGEPVRLPTANRPYLAMIDALDGLASHDLALLRTVAKALNGARA